MVQINRCSWGACVQRYGQGKGSKGGMMKQPETSRTLPVITRTWGEFRLWRKDVPWNKAATAETYTEAGGEQKRNPPSLSSCLWFVDGSQGPSRIGNQRFRAWVIQSIEIRLMEPRRAEKFTELNIAMLKKWLLLLSRDLWLMNIFTSPEVWRAGLLCQHSMWFW